MIPPMSPHLTPEELWALNMLRSSVSRSEAELKRQIAAVNAYLDLLKGKYGPDIIPNPGEAQEP